MELTINYPSRINECEVKFLLCNKIKKKFKNEKGISVRLEVPSRDERGLVYFDLVVFKSKTPMVVVEVKKKKSLKNKDQDNRYSLFGYPFINCYNKSMINYTVNQIWYHYKKVGNRLLISKNKL